MKITGRFPFIDDFYIIRASYCVKGDLFSIKGIRKRYLFCQNAVQNWQGVGPQAKASPYKSLQSNPLVGFLGNKYENLF